MLEYYAVLFDAVEINATYYRIPTPGGFGRMASVTPRDFGFVVKLHSAMTHERKPRLGEFSAFKTCLEPLATAGKLLGLLAQFPWSFQDTLPNRDYLVWLRGQLADYPLHMEFRHISWIQNNVFPFIESSTM